MKKHFQNDHYKNVSVIHEYYSVNNMSYNTSLTAAMILERLQICYAYAVNDGINITDDLRTYAHLIKTYNAKYGDISSARLSDVMKEFVRQEQFRRGRPALHSYRLWYLYYKTAYEECMLKECAFDEQNNFMSFRYLFDKGLAMRGIKIFPYSSDDWYGVCMMKHPIEEVSDRDKLNYIVGLVLYHQPDAYEEMERIDKLYGYELYIPSERAMKILINHIMLFDKLRVTEND